MQPTAGIFQRVGVSPVKVELNKKVKDELSGENAKSYVERITQFHRIQASTMFHEAAEYIKNELLKIGFKDAHIEQFPSDGEKMYWTYTSPMGWEVKSAELWLIEPEEQQIVRYSDIPTCLHTCSQATPSEGVVAELIDVGEGLKPKDYEGKEVKGKFVLATGRAKTVHQEAVYKRGATGVITDTLTYEMRNVRESIDLPDAHAYQAIWPTKENMNKVTFGFSLSKRQGNHLRALLKKDKTVKLRAKVDARLFAGNLDVVTVTIQGSSKPQEEIFLIAHLCHPKPSANDNGSGSGLLLEIARTMQTLIETDRIQRPSRTVRFIWVPETFGTIAYLYSHQNLPDHLVAGINLDMVGQDQELCKSSLLLDRTPDSLPSYLNDLVLSLIEQSVKEFDPTTGFGLASTFRYRVGAHSGGSDHHEFVDSTIGVPCVMLLQWPDLFYHSSMDTIDKVSSQSLKRVGWIATNAALILADADAEDAMFLASQTCSRGIERLEEDGREAVQALYKNREDEKLKGKAGELATALVQTATNCRNKLEHITWREKEAVKSVKRLASGAELDSLIDKLVKDLSSHGEQKQARMEEILVFVARAAGLVLPTQLEETEPEKDAKRIVPRKLFKGSLSMDTFKKLLGEAEYKWYEEISEKDRDFGKKASEILNYMNGEKTMHEILRAVSAEYTGIKAVHALKFVRDLQKLKLVTLQRR